MLAFELLGRLLPLVPSNPLLARLLIRCDREAPSRNAIIPAHHCFHSPGGPLKFSLEEHMFAVFGMRLSSDNKMLISTSNKVRENANCCESSENSTCYHKKILATNI